jgi:hypothetical protein
LIDTRSSSTQHVGQVQLDFKMGHILAAVVEETEAYFTFIVSPRLDRDSRGDTIVGPGFEIGSAPKWIADLVLPLDENTSSNHEFFQNITSKMKRGATGEGQFQRRSDASH